MSPELAELQPHFLQWRAEGETTIYLEYITEEDIYFEWDGTPGDAMETLELVGEEALYLIEELIKQDYIQSPRLSRAEVESIGFDSYEFWRYTGSLTIDLEENTIDHQYTKSYQIYQGLQGRYSTLDGGTTP